MLIQSPEEMYDFWKKIAQDHKHVLLHGDLWAGKTLFTKGFAAWLGIDENSVQSPTFTYMNIYNDKLLHVDMYRLEWFEDMVQKWIVNHIWEFDFVVIERPKHIEKLPISDPLVVTIEKVDDETRNIILP